jgi:hypothetical protein
MAERTATECVRVGLFQQPWQTCRMISRTLAGFSRSVAQNYGLPFAINLGIFIYQLSAFIYSSAGPRPTREQTTGASCQYC